MISPIQIAEDYSNAVSTPGDNAISATFQRYNLV
jgi:hypothetical protein